MRKMLTFLAAAVTIWGSAHAATAQSVDHPVVVELYTSQGCSSCPPADAFLGQLAMRSDVIPLALHVDYWDYIGWKDQFASPKYTKRQHSYAQEAGRRTVYTPQMIVQGQEHVVGNHPKNVNALISQHGEKPAEVDLNLIRSGNQVTISAEALGQDRSRLMVQLVRYTPEEMVDIRSGENAGRSIEYHNIVTSWERVGDWDMREPLSLKAKAAGDDPIVVILQERGPGRIVAAARLR